MIPINVGDIVEYIGMRQISENDGPIIGYVIESDSDYVNVEWFISPRIISINHATNKETKWIHNAFLKKHNND
jgi:hypothetical protein